MTEIVKHDEPVLIWTGAAILDGRLVIPAEPSALLLVASPVATGVNRNFHVVANHLVHHGFAVLYADLLTEDEAQFDSRTGHFRSDVALFASRLSGIVNWILEQRELREFRIACFATGAVAAAALTLANSPEDPFAALILAEPRTDLVAGMLRRVKAPTVLIAPDSDLAILRSNRDAYEALTCEKHLEVLPDSIRVIEDETNAEAVARLTLGWAAAHAQPVAAW